MTYKKSQQCLFCLKTLAKFQVDSTLMTMSYCSFIESVLTFSLICWFQSLKVKQKNLLNKVVRVCSKITVNAQKTLQDLERKGKQENRVLAQPNPKNIHLRDPSQRETGNFEIQENCFLSHS